MGNFFDLPNDSSLVAENLEERFNRSVRLVGPGANDLCGFRFTLDGVLVDEAGVPFRLTKHAKTQSDNGSVYHQLVEKIVKLVQDTLINVYDFDKIQIPVDASQNEPESFIFASKGAKTTTGKLLILIHGSGGVVAGLWSRKVILFDNLYRGSQLSYIDRAISEGYEIVLLNTNVNKKLVECDSWIGDVPIRGSESPEEHAIYVWDNFISQSKAQQIAIVAHSYGGVVTATLAVKRKDSFLKRVSAVAFTDSVHQLDRHKPPREVVSFFCKNARNWVTSDRPLDTAVGKVKKSPSDAPRVSAGNTHHEWTTSSAFHSVFAFFDEKLKHQTSQPQGTASANVKD